MWWVGISGWGRGNFSSGDCTVHRLTDVDRPTSGRYPRKSLTLRNHEQRRTNGTERPGQAYPNGSGWPPITYPAKRPAVRKFLRPCSQVQRLMNILVLETTRGPNVPI